VEGSDAMLEMPQRGLIASGRQVVLCTWIESSQHVCHCVEGKKAMIELHPA